jgi:hypothetical protein
MGQSGNGPKMNIEERAKFYLGTKLYKARIE